MEPHEVREFLISLEGTELDKALGNVAANAAREEGKISFVVDMETDGRGFLDFGRSIKERELRNGSEPEVADAAARGSVLAFLALLRALEDRR